MVQTIIQIITYKGNNVKKKKYFIAFAAVIAVAILAVSVFASRRNPKASVALSTTMEPAALTVLNEKLLQKTDLLFSKSDLKLSGYYFDGIRLYALVSSNADEVLEPKDFYIKTKSGQSQADLVYTAKDVQAVTGNETNDNLVIFNTVGFETDKKCSLQYKNNYSTGDFEVNNETLAHSRIMLGNEKMTVNYVDSGTTSVLLNCTVTDDIVASSYQFQTKDGVWTAFLTEKDGQNYSFLIPIKLGESSTGYLIANNENGNVLLKLPVTFT